MLVLLLAAFAFLPDRGIALMLLILGELLIASTAAMSACVWNSWMHDLLPRHGTNAFFARRLSWSTIVSLAGGLAAGVLVDNYWPGRKPRQAYAAPRLTTMLSKPLRDHGFRQLILFLASWSFFDQPGCAFHQGLPAGPAGA
jgi:MFS family permease